MKNKDYYYALIAVSALGVMSQTFELFNDYINRILIAGGIAALAVFYLFELKNVRKEHRKKKSYKFWKYFNLVSQDSAPIKKCETVREYGSSYSYEPPVGISSEKFKSKRLELLEYTNADDINIKYNNGNIVIDVYHSKEANIKHLE